MQRQVYVPIILDAVKRYGGTVRLGVQIGSIDEVGPAVILDGGEIFKADIVIGADGKIILLKR